MDDWDPFLHDYDFEEGKLYDDELSFWRSTYAQFLEDYSLDHGSIVQPDSDKGLSSGSEVSKQPSEMSILRSPLFWSLAVAAENPLCLHENMRQIFNKIKQLTAPEWDQGNPDRPHMGSAGCLVPIYTCIKSGLDCLARFLPEKDLNADSEEGAPLYNLWIYYRRKERFLPKLISRRQPQLRIPLI